MRANLIRQYVWWVFPRPDVGNLSQMVRFGSAQWVAVTVPKTTCSLYLKGQMPDYVRME